MTKLEIGLIVGVGLLITGMGLEYHLLKTKKVPIQVQAQSQIIQKDKSVEAAINPVKNLTSIVQVPQKTKLKASGTITISPAAQEEKAKISGKDQKTDEKTAMNLPNTSQSSEKSEKSEKLDYSIVKESDNVDRLIVKSEDGKNIIVSEDVEATQEVKKENSKKEILGLYGYSISQHKQVFGTQFNYHLTEHLTVSTGFIGDTIFIGGGISW